MLLTMIPLPEVQPPRFARDEYFRKRNGFQMAADERARVFSSPGRRLKALEEGNRGQRPCPMGI